MKKNDYAGIGVSLALHALLFLGLAAMTPPEPEPEPLGYIEVDLGAFAEGRPVQRATTPQPEATREPAPEPQPEVRAAPPKVAKPVELPKQTRVVDEEKVTTPKTETISPERQRNEAPVNKPEPTPEPKPVRPLGGGAEEGTTGATTGRDGTGEDEQKSAPFVIEGFNRQPTYTVLPRYAEQVNAVIKIAVTVDPRGLVIGRRPVIKGNPALEQAVMAALAQWRFNPLPPNAPQQNQTGTVTFRFRLE